MNSRDVALEYVVIESSTHPGKIHRCIPLEWKSLNTGMAHLDTGCLYFFFASGKTRRQVHNVVCTADWVQSFAGAIAGFVAAEIELVRLPARNIINSKLSASAFNLFLKTTCPQYHWLTLLVGAGHEGMQDSRSLKQYCKE